jgi:hypothetical protein
MNATDPPQIASNVTFNHTYRFVSSSGSTTPVTVGSLMCAAGTICTVANTTVTAFYGGVKVNRISIWTPPASQGAAATCAVSFTGGANTPDREFSDSTMSVARPAHVSCRPPRGALSSFWNNSTSAATVLFRLTAPAGSIIDVSVSLILFDDVAVLTQATSAVATGTLGAQYYLSLDSNATHLFTPVSLQTTT